MTEIKGYWTKCSTYGKVVAVLIEDEQAMRACLMREMTGWNIQDAVRKFNKRLENFGYRITGEVEHWIGDPYA